MSDTFMYSDPLGREVVVEMKEEDGLVSRAAYDLVVKERDEARLLSLKQSKMLEELSDALDKIANWNELTLEYRVNYGSNGERDYYRNIARKALERKE